MINGSASRILKNVTRRPTGALVLSMALLSRSVDAEVAKPADDASVAVMRYESGSAASGWLPFEYYDGRRIFVSATVNGKQTQVMLDSGASSTVLDNRFATALGLKPHGNFKGEGSGGSADYSIVHGLTITLGKLTITPHEAVALDISSVEKQLGHPLPVILGGDAFSKAVVDIDFTTHRIAFRDPASFESPAKATALPIAAHNENRAISVMVEQQPAMLLFDLGNGGALSLFPRFWDRPAFKEGRKLASTISGGWGGMGIEKVTMVSSVTLGGSTFHEVPATLDGTRSADARSGQLDGNLGMGLLSRFHLFVDFAHNRVLFEDSDTSHPFPANHIGLELRPGKAGYTILAVVPASPAALAGFQAGQVVVAVEDGRSRLPIALSDRWTASPVGSVLRIYLADGQMKEVIAARYF